MIVLAVALAAIGPIYRSVANHSFTAIIGEGVIGSAQPLLQREVPDLVMTNNLGHDGQQFYAIARHPFDPNASAPYLAGPVYRYRRILFPLLGWALAPHGGTRLIAALLVVGLVGVALSALSIGLMPGAPIWLPLVVGVTPGVIAATSLTLSDSLALGFTLAAFAAATRRHPGIVLTALVLGTLTRETVYLAALALVLTPGLSTRWRIAYLAVPVAVLGAWTVWVAHALGAGVGQSASDQFSFPFTGWIGAKGGDLVIGLLSGIILVVGMVRTRDDLPVFVYLGLLLVLFSVLSSDVTASWINTTRVVIAGIPLTVWAITRHPPAVDSAGLVSPGAT